MHEPKRHPGAASRSLMFAAIAAGLMTLGCGFRGLGPKTNGALEASAPVVTPPSGTLPGLAVPAAQASPWWRWRGRSH